MYRLLRKSSVASVNQRLIIPYKEVKRTINVLKITPESSLHHYPFPIRTLCSSPIRLNSDSTSIPAEEMDNETSSIQRQELVAFDETYNRIINNLIPNKPPQELAEVYRWLEKVIHYNVPHGKRNRGLAVVMTYRLLVPPSEHTSENLEFARILGWCVELLQAYFLVTDDLMDQSITRRGQLCWYRQDGIGLMACNDSFLLESCIYDLLRIYFKDKSYYNEILDLLLDVKRLTSYGQCLDVLANSPGKKPDLNSFTIERYAATVKYKTAYYSFSLPVRLSMYMVGLSDRGTHDAAETILLKMGHFFQVQDDYLDCFGDPNVIGKIGTDIEDGKCCWPIVMALQMCNAQQKRILQDNYAHHNTEAVSRVKGIYNELNIKDLYLKYEEQTYHEICQLIKDVTVSSKLPSNIFYGFLSKIHRRNK